MMFLLHFSGPHYERRSGWIVQKINVNGFDTNWANMCSPSAEFPSSFKDCSWSPPTPTTRLPPTRSEYKGRINGDHPRYPRVVVRDRLGNKLDTFTYLQEAIYRAEWNVKNSHEAVLPEEWRLPKAPNPARPDYSRTAPVLASVRGRLRSRWDRTQDVSRSVPNARLHVSVWPFVSLLLIGSDKRKGWISATRYQRFVFYYNFIHIK